MTQKQSPQIFDFRKNGKASTIFVVFRKENEEKLSNNLKWK